VASRTLRAAGSSLVDDPGEVKLVEVVLRAFDTLGREVRAPPMRPVKDGPPSG
jgi:hypothetical protein